jgi:hypothetical protein
VYHVPKFPSTWKDGRAAADERPTVCYRYGNAEGNRFSQPTFSPDGSRLAYADAGGVKVVTVPGFENGCSVDGASQSGQLVVPGASEPDWGPADVPPPRPVKNDGPGPGPGPGPDPVQPTGELTATAAKPRLGAALRRGLKVSVTVPADALVSATAKAGGRTVAKAAAKQLRAGERTITLRFTKAAKRALKAKGSVRLTVTVIAGAQTATAKVTLRR